MKHRYYLFLSAVAVGCFLPIVDVQAKSGECGIGEFLFSTKCRDCKPGCYCYGGHTTTLSLDHKDKISASDLEKYCRRETNSCPHQGKDGYGECGRKGEAKIERCPAGFPKSDAKATSAEQCYVMSGNERLYNKKVSCAAGKYLPKGKGSCADCSSKGGNYYCTGVTAYPSTTADQGLSECASGKKPNSARTGCGNIDIKCKAGQYLPKGRDYCIECKTGHLDVCEGGTFQENSNADQGIITCGNDLIANKEHSKCVSESGIIVVPKGQYLPADTYVPKPCPKASKKYCPGGEFTHSKKNQGMYDCPMNGRSSSDMSTCTLTLSKEQLKYGPGGKSTTFLAQCWIHSEDPERYTSCLLGTNKRYYK